MWPGAKLLNDYLSKNAEMLQGCSVLELGSGVGEQWSNHILLLVFYSISLLYMYVCMCVIKQAGGLFLLEYLFFKDKNRLKQTFHLMDRCFET